jgi:plastocyanin
LIRAIEEEETVMALLPFTQSKRSIEMPKYLVSAVFGLGLVALNTPTVYAQGSPEVIVRPGDTIEWVAVSGGPHKVRFGADEATSLDKLKDILENFTPPLTAAGDSPPGNPGPLTKATVKADAAGKTFVFTCGVHPTDMLSLTFTVADKVAGQPARNHKISAEAGRHWHLHVDTTP